jgi:hypothetical protein
MRGRYPCTAHASVASKQGASLEFPLATADMRYSQVVLSLPRIPCHSLAGGQSALYHFTKACLSYRELPRSYSEQFAIRGTQQTRTTENHSQNGNEPQSRQKRKEKKTSTPNLHRPMMSSALHHPDPRARRN